MVTVFVIYLRVSNGNIMGTECKCYAFGNAICSYGRDRQM